MIGQFLKFLKEWVREVTSK